MSLKDLFKETKAQFLSTTSLNELTGTIESADFIQAADKKADRFIPLIDFSREENFAKFGSAQKYYYDSIRRITNTYPYDGSRKEKILWELSSSYLDLYLFDNGYPRTTGYANFIGEPGTSGNTGNNYPPAGDDEYILIKGGPNEGGGSSIYINPDTGDANYREGANLWDTAKKRENNLKIGGIDGNTVEFWLKKDAFVFGQEYFEFILDVHVTGTTESDADYGRLIVALATTGTINNASKQPFLVRIGSGSGAVTSITQYMGASTLTTASIADGEWHHYAIRAKNTGSNFVVDLFVDGVHNDQTVDSSMTINNVSGAIVATLGAQSDPWTAVGGLSGSRGWSKFSGSIDEFRFWKVWRNAEQIQTRWFDQVGGGTNTDKANTHLGVYYKFNEGITLTSSTDSIVLDYSGRISNGAWTGYNSSFSRQTGSAIDDTTLTTFSGSEFKDPIIYSNNPDVRDYLSVQTKKGKEYDYTNPSSLYYTLPAWILDEHDVTAPGNEAILDNPLWNLTQIMGSYFDDVTNQIKSIPSLAQPTYLSGAIKPPPFMNRIVESAGFITPEIFSALSALETFESRDNTRIFSKNVQDIKNIIYKNIYNNLTYINKTKGTEKSFRNLIRCFGVDDEIYKFNIYAKNAEFTLENNFRPIAQRYKMVNFNTTASSDAVVYQYSSSLNANSTTFISASRVDDTSQEGAGLPFSVEANILFPNRVSQGDYRTLRKGASVYQDNYPLIATASLFGMHTADNTDASETTWAIHKAETDAFLEMMGVANNDRFTVNVPSDAGGGGYDITVRVVSGAPSDGTANEVQVREGGDDEATRNRMLGVFNGNDGTPTSVYKFGAGSGDYTTGIIGITASASVGSTLKISAAHVGMDGNDIVFTDVQGAIVANGSTEASPAYVGSGVVGTLGSNDYANFIVQSVKNEQFGNKAYFELTGTIGGFIPRLTSSMFDEVYVNSNWQFLVSLYPSAYPNANEVSGALLQNYTVEFTGIQNVLDTTINTFTVTGSMNTTQATQFLVSPKRTFVGAHRTNFTGTLLQSTDVKFNTFRVWQNKLSYDDIKQHAIDPRNYGVSRPAENAYLFNTSINKVFVPKKETLLLHWNFDTLTGSDSSGKFIIEDLTSGSSTQINRYGWLSNLKKKQYTGEGQFFPASNTKVVSLEDVVTGQNNLPEVMTGDDMVTVMQNDDIYFTRDKRPVFFDLFVEKSPYQNISEEMMKFIATAKDFNDLIGHVLDRYRDDYKALPLLRNLFFERVKNVPDVDKYIDYFKWFDIAVTSMIQKLAPMSSGLDDKPLRTIIESHILERNKYRSKFPSYEFKQSDPVGHLFGINEQLYDWEFGHSPLSSAAGSLFFVNPGTATDGSESVTIISTNGTSITYTAKAANDYPNNEFDASGAPSDNVTQLMGAINAAAGHNAGVANSKLILASTSVSPGRLLSITQTQPGADGNTTITSNLANTTVINFTGGSKQENNCLWWNERAERDGALITSGDAAIDSNRQTVLNVINNLNDAAAPILSGSAGSYSGSTFALRRFAQPYKIGAKEQRGSHGGINFDYNRRINYWRSAFRADFDVAAYVSVTSYVATGSCDDITKPNKKIYRNYDFNGITDNIASPFNVVSCSLSVVDAGVYGANNNLQVVDLHYDAYGDNAATPMQGPFTDTHVGGSQHRHVPINTGSDTRQNRPELFILTTSGDTLNVLSADQNANASLNTSLPRAEYYRDEIAKRPLNVKNINYTTSSAILGNYNSNYEIVLTSGRDINNRYLVQSGGTLLTASNTVFFFSGTLEYTLPRRDLTGSTKSIIVNRFSAPGDPYTMGEGMLDVLSGEYSVYNALPWRNLDVRLPQLELLTDHCKQFGYFSDAQYSSSWREAIRSGIKAAGSYPGSSGSVNADDYAGTASFQKVNRNPRKVIKYVNEFNGVLGTTKTSSLFDNGWIVHQIPQSDRQYAWITGTAENYVLGFEQPDFSNASLASTDIDFVSISDSGSQGILVDFVGLNTLIVDGVDSSANLLSSSDYINDNFPTLQDVMLTNALLLHRNGPYNGTSWKLYRKEDYPIVRAHRKENRLSFLTSSLVRNDVGAMRRVIGIRSTIEPPLTGKFHPLSHRLIVKQDQSSDVHQDVILKHSYLNNIAYFTDHSADKLDLDQTLLAKRNIPTEEQTLDAVNYYIFGGELPQKLNPIKEFKNLAIKETIYPREQYTYLSKMRQRESFKNNFWRTSRTVRSEEGSVYPFIGDEGATDPTALDATASIWTLDARLNFATASPGRIASSSLEGGTPAFGGGTIFPPISGGSDQAGVLQNNASIFDIYTFFISYPSAAWLFPQYNRRIQTVIATDTTHEYKSGDTKWEAGVQSGLSPFYDTYDDYVDEIKRTGKAHGLLPEFRISEHMDFYINQKFGNFLAENTASFSLTGSNLSSSINPNFFKTYAHTDFLKTFRIVNKSYEGKADPRKITLSANVIMKFLPYKGFYPAQRTNQIAKLFYDDYKDNIGITSSYADVLNIDETLGNSAAGFARAVFQPLFAPGILYNSVKSGLAVDYPINITGSGITPNLTFTGTPNQRNSLGVLYDIPRINSGFNFRVPFEGLLEPEGTYGGKLVLDSEPHPSASLNNITASLGIGKPTYKLAINNFLASTIDFFKPHGKLTTLASLSDTSPAYANGLDAKPGFKVGTEYTMRITLSNAKFRTQQELTDQFDMKGLNMMLSASYVLNPQSLIMYARTGSDAGIIRSDYYGSSFGPPVTCGNTGRVAQSENTQPAYGSASFEPFTPSYYDGYSHIELTYRPRIEGYVPLNEVVQELTQSFYRWPTHSNFLATAAATTHMMQLSASLNYLQMAEEKSVTFDALGDPLEVGGDAAGNGFKLVIQPKWETPVLNFANVPVTLPNIGSGSVARGMWHQNGVLPKSTAGIWLQIQDLHPLEKDDTTTTGSLADFLGFKKTPVRIGEVAQQKIISEAIVAIPFIKGADGTQQRFPLNKVAVELAEELIRTGGATVKFKEAVALNPLDKPSAEMVEMVKKMKKFVLPPRLDFVTNKTIDPFAIFILDFNVTLEQQDLLNIWQNLPPQIGRSFQQKQASLPAAIFNPENISEEELSLYKGAPLLSGFPEETQWLVFKAKERAAFNYFAKTADTRDDERFKFNFEIGSAGAERASVPDYSYNWPFDFFSLIELAKIDANVELEPKPNFKTPQKLPEPGPGVVGAEVLKQNNTLAVPINVPVSQIPMVSNMSSEVPPQSLIDAAASVAGTTISPTIGTSLDTSTVGAPTGLTSTAPTDKKKKPKSKPKSKKKGKKWEYKKKKEW